MHYLHLFDSTWFQLFEYLQYARPLRVSPSLSLSESEAQVTFDNAILRTFQLLLVAGHDPCEPEEVRVVGGPNPPRSVV